MHTADGPCSSVWLSSGESEWARGSLGSCGVVIVEYNLIQMCNHVFKALPCSHERNTGVKADLLCSVGAAVASLIHTMRALHKGREDSTLRAIEAPQPQAMCSWLGIWSELFRVTKINLHNPWYSPCIPPAPSRMVVTSLNLSLSTKEWGQNKILKGSCSSFQRVL